SSRTPRSRMPPTRSPAGSRPSTRWPSPVSRSWSTWPPCPRTASSLPGCRRTSPPPAVRRTSRSPNCCSRTASSSPTASRQTSAPPSGNCGRSPSSGLLECCFCVAGGVPAGQQAECIRVRAAGCGTAHDDVQALVGGEFHGLVGERQLPDERVVQALGAGPVPPDFVPGPALPEGVAAGGQLADQVRQGLVVGVAADLGAKGGDVLVGDGVPVRVELGGGGIQEGEACGVDRPGRAGEDRREQGPGQGVAGEDVQA